MSPSRRLLIAENDEKLRRLLFSKFLEADIYSDCSADGVDAIDWLSNRHYWIVLLDLELPDSQRVIDHARRMPDASRPMVVALAPREVAASLDVDVVQIIVRKPFSISELVTLVRGCLAWSEKKASKAAAATSPAGDGTGPALPPEDSPSDEAAR